MKWIRCSLRSVKPHDLSHRAAVASPYTVAIPTACPLRCRLFHRLERHAVRRISPPEAKRHRNQRIIVIKFVTWQLPIRLQFEFDSTAVRLLFDCCSTVVRLLFDCSSTVVRLLFDCYSTVVRLLFNCYSTVVRLLFDCCSTAVRLLFDCCSIVIRLLFDCCSTTVRLLFDSTSVRRPFYCLSKVITVTAT